MTAFLLLQTGINCTLFLVQILVISSLTCKRAQDYFTHSSSSLNNVSDVYMMQECLLTYFHLFNYPRGDYGIDKHIPANSHACKLKTSISLQLTLADQILTPG